MCTTAAVCAEFGRDLRVCAFVLMEFTRNALCASATLRLHLYP